MTPASLADFPEVAWPLSIAEQSVGALEAAIQTSGPYSPDAARHSAVVIVFSAAAMEAALNSFISRPLLNIEDAAVRDFFGRLIHHRFRGNVPAKLAFIKDVCPELRERRELLQQLEKLAAARNAIVHIFPDYGVALGPHPDAEWPLREGDWIEYPGLEWTKSHVARPSVAVDGHRAAAAFIDALPLTLTYEPMRILYDDPASVDRAQQFDGKRRTDQEDERDESGC